MNLYGIDFGHTNYKVAFCENGNISAIYKNDYNEVSVSDDILNIIKKNDFEYAAQNRKSILAEWQRRYDSKSEPKS